MRLRVLSVSGGVEMQKTGRFENAPTLGPSAVPGPDGEAALTTQRAEENVLLDEDPIEEGMCVPGGKKIRAKKTTF